MIFKITYKLGGMEFSAEVENIAQAYEYIKSIINANLMNFANPERALSDYMTILMQIEKGNLLSLEKSIFKIEKVMRNERARFLADTMNDAERIISKMYGVGGVYCDGLIEGYWERRRERIKRCGFRVREASRNDL